MRFITILILISGLLTLRLFSDDSSALPQVIKEEVEGNWPTWRGPNRDGISAETGLLSSWEQKEPSLSWKVSGLGSGLSSVAITGGRIYTMGESDGSIKMFALSSKDGSQIWVSEIESDSSGYDIRRPAQGPNSTPSVDGNRVYGLTHAGLLVCVSTVDGSILWTKDFSKDFEGQMESGWGYSESVIIDGENLIEKEDLYSRRVRGLPGAGRDMTPRRGSLRFSFIQTLNISHSLNRISRGYK